MGKPNTKYGAYPPVNVYSLQFANWKDPTIFKFGKPTISMGHGFNSYVTNYQRVIPIVIHPPDSKCQDGSNDLTSCILQKSQGSNFYHILFFRKKFSVQVAMLCPGEWNVAFRVSQTCWFQRQKWRFYFANMALKQQNIGMYAGCLWLSTVVYCSRFSPLASYGLLQLMEDQAWPSYLTGWDVYQGWKILWLCQS